MSVSNGSLSSRGEYRPPWADVSIIGIAGSSGSGKSKLSEAIVSTLNLPWVTILSMDSFYNTLTPEQHAAAHRNEFDFDSPEAVDFNVLVQRLQDLKAGKRAEIPIYSFSDHQRQKETTSIYSPHVLILEGIFALYDPRVLELLDMRIFCEADADTCLSRRILRDVSERDRDVEGIIKQWFRYVKPNLTKFVDPQREVADIIVPRGIENKVAIDMVTQFIQRKLAEKSAKHCAEMKKLDKSSKDNPFPNTVEVIGQQSGMMGRLIRQFRDESSSPMDSIGAFDQVTERLLEHGLHIMNIHHRDVPTTAVITFRAHTSFTHALSNFFGKQTLTGRIQIHSPGPDREPELHLLSLPPNIAACDAVLLVDPQIESGGAALMAVRVLVDHGVPEDRIVVISYEAVRKGLGRLAGAWPSIKIVVGEVVDSGEGEREGKVADGESWIDERYFKNLGSK